MRLLAALVAVAGLAPVAAQAAWTGSATTTSLGKYRVRVTGLSLAAGANGTVGLYGDAGAGVQLPANFPTTVDRAATAASLSMTDLVHAFIRDSGAPTGTAPAVNGALTSGQEANADQVAAGALSSVQEATADSAPAGALTSAQEATADQVAAGALTSSQEATADAAAQGGGYVQADVESIRTLANSLKTHYNALQVDVAALKATYDGFITLPNSLKTRYNAAQVDIAALKAAYDALPALPNALKAKYNVLQTDVGNLRTTYNGYITLPNSLKGRYNAAQTDLAALRTSYNNAVAWGGLAALQVAKGGSPWRITITNSGAVATPTLEFEVQYVHSSTR